MQSSTPDDPDNGRTPENAAPGSATATTTYPVHYAPARDLLRRAWTNLSRHIIPLKPGDKAPVLYNWATRGAATDGELTGWELTYGHRCNVGLLLGQGYAAFDLDLSTSPAFCSLVAGHIELLLGQTAKRQGQAPKTLLLYRVVDTTGAPASVPSVNISVDRADPSQRIQVMGTTRGGQSRSQIVIAGVHPKTGKTYSWTHDVLGTDAAAVATVTVAEFEAAVASLTARYACDQAPTKPQEALTESEAGQGIALPSQWLPVPDLLAVWGIDDALETRVRNIDAAPDRSAELLGVVDQLYQARLQDEQILSLLTDPEYESQCLRDHRKGDRRQRADWLAKYVLPKAKARFWVPLAYQDFDPILEQVDPETVKKHQSRVRLKSISARSLAHTPPPPRPWLIPDLLPRGVVSSLYGPPGLGKTMAAVQLCLGVMFGASWLGEPVVGGPAVALGLFCEDDRDEIHRRVAAICQALGYDLSKAPAAGDFLILDRSAEISNIWMEFQGEHGEGKVTALYQAIREYVQQVKPAVMVVDVVADVFGGNENARRHVNQFVKGALAVIARENNIALQILAHPSKAGSTDGWGQSGSTSWQGSVRQQLNLLPFHTDGDLNNKATRVDDMVRAVVTKSNYLAASSGLRVDGLALRKGQGGVLLRDVSAGAGAVTGRAVETEALVRQAVRELLAARMAPSLAVNNPRNNIAHTAVRLGARKGIRVGRDECQDMAEDLVRRGVLVEEKLFSRGNRQAVYGLRLADEFLTESEVSTFPGGDDSPF